MKKIGIEDKVIFDKYRSSRILNSEYQFTTIFAWAHRYNFCYIEKEGVLYIFGNQNNGNLQCYFPIGEKSIEEKLDFLKKTFRENMAPINIRPVSKDMLDQIKPFLGENFTIGTKESYRDYICDYSLLLEYKGSEYKKKRKLTKTFISRYNYKYFSICKTDIESIKAAMHSILYNTDSTADIDEWTAYTRILDNYESLNLRGGVIVIDGIIEAIAIAESCFDSIYVHVRRCNKKFIGIYPAMLQLLIKNEFVDRKYKYVNLQDDMGVENLRKSKLSYKPVLLFEKYFIQEEVKDYGNAGD